MDRFYLMRHQGRSFAVYKAEVQDNLPERPISPTRSTGSNDSTETIRPAYY